jgi:AcrR family transcriptional regulator
MAPSEGATRKRILEAALDIASEDGPAAITTRKVAQRAGVNLGLLHYYFKSKDALVIETVEHFIDNVKLESMGEGEPKLALEELLVESLAKVYSILVKRVGLIFGLIGLFAKTIAKNPDAPIDPQGRPLPGPSVPYAMVRRVQAALLPYIRAYLVSKLGDKDEELLTRRTIQLLLSVFNPLLFTDLPRLVFGYDLRDPEVQKRYLREVVRDAGRI